MLGVEDMGLVIVIWGVCALLFRDWVVRFDLMLRERITGDFFGQPAIEEQQQLLEKTGRLVLGIGLVLFAIGAGLHFARLA